MIVDLLTPSHLRTRPRLSDEELGTLIEMGEEEGALHEGEAEMIQEIIKLGDKTAKDCMTPRVDTFALPDDLTNEEAIARLKEKRHRRVPVYADTPDQILGIIDVKHVPARSVGPLHREISCSVVRVRRRWVRWNCFEAFLTHPQGLAVVVDEFGGTEGIITLADIVEEIISDALPRAMSIFTSSRSRTGNFSSAATPASTI